MFVQLSKPAVGPGIDRTVSLRNGDDVVGALVPPAAVIVASRPARRQSLIARSGWHILTVM